MDMSQMSDEELTKIAGGNNTPVLSSAPSLANMSDEELKQIASPVIANAIGEATTFRPVEKGKAILSGAANAGVDLLQGIADLPAYIASKIPGINKIVTQDVAERTFKENKEGLDLLRPQKYFPSLNNTKQENPISYGAGYLPATLLGSGGAFNAVEKATRIPQAASGLVKFLTKQPSQIIAGATTGAMSGTDTTSKNIGATFGAGSVPIINATGTLISSLGKKATAKQVLKEQLSGVNKDLADKGFKTFDDAAGQSIFNLGTKVKEIEKEGYESIKSLPGTIAHRPVTRAIYSLGEKTKGVTDEQKNILTDLFESTKDMSDMSQAVTLKQNLGKYYTKFSGKNATPTIFNKYKALQQQVDDAIELRATEAGKAGDWKSINKFHHDIVKPLQDFGLDDIITAIKEKDVNPTQYQTAIDGLVQRGLKTPNTLKSLLTSMDDTGSKLVEGAIIKNVFDDISINPETFNTVTAFKKINQHINKFSGVLSTDSINSLKGIKSIMKESGLDKPKTKNVMVSMMIGAGAGGMAGATISPAMSGIGTIAGMAIAPKVSKLIQRMVESPKGLYILQGIGAKAPWADKARKTILDLIKVSPGVGAGKLTSPEDNPNAN